MEASITNGKITAKVSFEGWISFYNDKGELLTEEYWRNRNRIDRYSVPIRVEGRELKPIPGTNDYSLAARFEAFDDEHIYGMGQYQDKSLDKKGSVLELCHRNSQASVPFTYQAEDTVSSGTILLSAMLYSETTRPNGLHRAPKNLIIS